MSLKDFIKKKRINRETLIALHNKDNKWLICVSLDTGRLDEYLEYEVIEDNDINLKGYVKCIKLNYEPTMALDSLRYKEAQREATVTIKKKRK
jgi:hypothetical protein